VDDILRALATCAAETPAGQWIIGEGYDERHLRELRAPTLSELDVACPHHPVLLVQSSYHEVVVNSRAHEAVDLPLHRADPPGGEVGYDRRGRPTGCMIENAAAPFYMEAIRQALMAGDAVYFDRLARYQGRLFAAGITRVYDPAVSPLMERTLARAVERDVLRIPVLMMPSSGDGTFMPPRDRLAGARTGDGAGLLRTGPLKLFMDGGQRLAFRVPLHVVGAAMVTTFRRSLSRRSLAPLRSMMLTPMRLDVAAWCVRGGILFYTEEEAREIAGAAVERGMSVAVHAEGNVAIDRTLRVLSRSRPDRAPGVSPNRIEHFFLPDADAIPRAVGLDLAIAVQPTILGWVGEQLLDAGLNSRQAFMPLRDMLDAGLAVAGSSDAPAVDFDPLVGIRCAVRRRTSAGEALDDGQDVTIHEALRMYTVNAARSGGLEHEAGTLAPGKCADLVVLNVDPTALSAGDLDQLAVEWTICGGADVYTRLTATTGLER
jgi:predicted amidohydrolase YtcJ